MLSSTRTVLVVAVMSHVWSLGFLTTTRRGVSRRHGMMMVQAFSTQSSSSSSSLLSRRSSGQSRLHLPQDASVARRAFVTDRSAAAVDEDLDAALDDILGQALSEARNPTYVGTTTSKTHMKNSRPIPQNFVEVEQSDLKDPQVLSTSNPRWVQAGLDPAVIDVLSSKGITTFTPVQAEAFGPILARRDVIGRSRTGTGKTLAFGLPALTRLVDFTQTKGKRDASGRMERGRKPSMLVLCPTRELARQVQEELAQVARPLGLYTDVFHGGVSYDPQARALRTGVDVVVGTPGRIMDHMKQRNLDLSECDVVVLDEADEMLNMGFADDVEIILKGVGSANNQKTQCLMFSATTPSWVKDIGRQYQQDVIQIDSTGEAGGARVATTVRHIAVQLPPGVGSKKAILEDIIAVEISRDAKEYESDDEALKANPLAAAAAQKKRKSSHAMQQKIFGKTIVFTETKKAADELVSGGVFKSLTAQALHGDVGQKQRDSIMAAFRAGAFNVLVATDVAARGIDIQDVDLVVQIDPPRDTDTYVHRSGRTGRAGKSGVSVLLFSPQQARDIVRIERELGHGFKFDLSGPPSIEATLNAAARTSAIASKTIPDEVAKYFKGAAAALLDEGVEPEEVVARCLAAISRRSTEVESRSLITGELGFATVEMVYNHGRPVAPNDVMFTVSKLSRMSRKESTSSFDSDVGKIQINSDSGSALFDMGVEDAKKLIEFSKDSDSGGATFSLIKEIEIERGRHFGQGLERGGGKFARNGRSDSRSGYQNDNFGGNNFRDQRRGQRTNNFHGQNRRANHEGRESARGALREGRGGALREGREPSRGGPREGRESSRGGFRGRYENPRGRNNNSEGW